MKPRLIILNLVAFLAVQSYASAGGVSAGLFNSPKGFGICVDYVASDIIYNSYSVYADCYGMLSGTYRNPGVKACYLHYNRLASFDYDGARGGLFLGPGASSGLVRDNGSDKFGVLLTADIALAVRLSFPRHIDIEMGMVAELGFIARNTPKGVQMNIYNNGLTQALIPTLKIMARF